MATRVFLSPSNQTGNAYACGHSTEAETCGKIAKFCESALIRCGFEVKTVHLDSMAIKCAESDAFGANLHVPIHTNAAAAAVGGTRVYCSAFGSEGHKAAKAIFDRLAPITPGTSESVKEAPNLYEIRVPKAPTAYVEAEFHHVAEQADWIETHAEAIGEAIAAGICDYFGLDYVAEPEDEDETGCGCTALEAWVEELETRIAALEKRTETYTTLHDVPSWARPEIKALCEAGLLEGDGSGNLNIPKAALQPYLLMHRVWEACRREAV